MSLNESLETSPHCSTTIEFLLLASGEQILHVSSNIHALLGYSERDFIETTQLFSELIHSDDQDIAAELFSITPQEMAKNINFRCRQANGNIICLHGCYQKYYDQSTKLTLYLQLTDAKALKHPPDSSVLLSNFSALMKNSEDYIFFKDRNHVFTAASQTLVAITNPSEKWTDLIGKTDYEVFPEEYADAYYKLEKQIFAGAPSVQEIQKTLDNQGNIGWVDNRKYPILNNKGDIIGLFGIARDITENVLNQQKVQQLLGEQKAILENHLIGIATVKDRKILWANPAYTQLFGYSQSELLNMSTRKLYANEEDYLSVGKAYATIEKQPVILNELKFLRKDGQFVWVNLSGTLLNTQEGISQWSFVDITELKRSKLTLQNSETRFRTLFESHGDAVMLLDDHSFLSCNKATLDIFGCPSVDIFRTKTPVDLSPPLQPCGTTSAELAKQWLSKAKQQNSLSFEWVHKRVDNGHIFPTEVLLTTMFLDGHQVIQAVVRDISQRKQIENALRESEARWKFALEGAGDGAWEYDFLAQTNMVSNQLTKILGIEQATPEYPTPLSDWAERLHPDNHADTLAAFQAILDNKSDNYAVEQRVRCEDGQYKWLLSRGMVIRAEDSTPLRMIGTSSDITERKQAEHELRIAAVAFESKEGITVTDSNGVILKINHAFSQITGYNASEAIGNNPNILQSGRHEKEFYIAMWESLEKTGVWEGEIWNKRKNGDIYPEYLTISEVKDSAGTVSNYVASFHDITEIKTATDKIKRLAFYDPLTNLPNRRLLLDRLGPALASSARSKRLGALLFIDLDNFKIINDTYGHDMGDLLLQQVANRLLSCVREGDTVSRIGGDEFVVMLEDLSDQELEAAQLTKIIANKILATLNQPYLLNSLKHHSTPSIGATLLNGYRHSTEELLKYADIAMYDAKASGRNTLRFFDHKMQSILTERAVLEDQLQQALLDNQFKLHYQPIIINGTTIAVEALIRWQHPDQGLLLPSKFIEIAEETGVMLAISAWVLKEVCVQLKYWESQTEKQHLQVSLNISALQFRQVNFSEKISQALSLSDINPNRLNLEITEKLLAIDLNDAMIKLHTLRKVGVSFSIDKFGTGYSSLPSLKKLPITRIKLDQSFIHMISNDLDNDAIIKTVIAMANSLGIQLIAVGVETEQQRNFLALHGCLAYQGNFFAKPMLIKEFEKYLIPVAKI